jgi:hypothetical protein
MTSWVEEFWALNKTTEEVVDVKKEHKLDLFKVVLPALDKRNKNFYNSVTDDERAELAKLVWTVTRWMSSTQSSSEHHLIMVNDVINKHTSSLKSHPELQWKLLAICGYGKPQRHVWVSPPKGVKKNKLEEALIKLYPLIKDDELELLMHINGEVELKMLFKDNGMSDAEIKALFS